MFKNKPLPTDIALLIIHTLNQCFQKGSYIAGNRGIK